MKHLSKGKNSNQRKETTNNREQMKQTIQTTEKMHNTERKQYKDILEKKVFNESMQNKTKYLRNET